MVRHVEKCVYDCVHIIIIEVFAWTLVIIYIVYNYVYGYINCVPECLVLKTCECVETFSFTNSSCQYKHTGRICMYVCILSSSL